MIASPIDKNPNVLRYIDALKKIVSIEADMEPDSITLDYTLDYHNFVNLATTIGKRFFLAEKPSYIKEGIKLFSETLRDDVLQVAMRNFWEKLENEKENGELAEMYASKEHHYITLHDALRWSFKRCKEKLEFHGGKPALSYFEQLMADLADKCYITVYEIVNNQTWSMCFDYQNTRSLFFEAPATDGLFRSALAPIVENFYNKFKI